MKPIRSLGLYRLRLYYGGKEMDSETNKFVQEQKAEAERARKILRNIFVDLHDEYPEEAYKIEKAILPLQKWIDSKFSYK